MNKAKYAGSLLGVKGYYIKGWAFRSDQPDEPVRVELAVDGQPQLEVIADEYSPTLALKLGTSGRHYFRLPISMPHLLKDRTIEARIVGTDFLLRNSPQVARGTSLLDVDTKGLSYFRKIGRDEGEGSAITLDHGAKCHPRHSTLLFIANPMTPASGAIITGLARKCMREDTQCLSGANLFVVEYAPSNADSSVMELLSRLDASTRELLGTFQNLVFVDPVDRLPSAVRGLSSASRLMIVLTPGIKLPEVEVGPIDVLIAAQDLDLDSHVWRRLIRYDARLGSTYSAERAIKRALLEAQPRALNVFFQIFGAPCRYDLPWELSDYHDALIIVEQTEWYDASVTNFFEYACKIASRITAMYASEEFFLRYRTLIQNANDDRAKLGLLISWALEDGCRIDVRN